MAPLEVAMIGFLARVHPQMGLQISFLIEGSLALFIGADEFFFSSVGLQMDLESLNPAVRVVASFVGAPELFDSDMGVHMIIQVSFGHE